MIEQWEITFSKNKTSNQMADERFALLDSRREEFCRYQDKQSTIVRNVTDDNEVIYFDLINEGCDSESIKSEIQKKAAENLLRQTHTNKKFSVNTLNEQASVEPLPTLTENTEDLLYSLLVYLDRILYLDEMSEKLEKMEYFIDKGKIDEVNSIAHNCIFISINCGMNSSIEPLRNLSEIQITSQPANLKTLWKLIKKNFEDFKFELNKYFEQIKMVIHNQVFS